MHMRTAPLSSASPSRSWLGGALWTYFARDLAPVEAIVAKNMSLGDMPPSVEPGTPLTISQAKNTGEIVKNTWFFPDFSSPIINFPLFSMPNPFFSRQHFLFSRQKWMFLRQDFMFSRRNSVFSRGNHTFSRGNHAFSREHHAFSRENHTFSRGNHAFSREKHRFSREKHRFSRETHAFSRGKREFSLKNVNFL